MSVSVERLKSINAKLKKKVEEKKNSSTTSSDDLFTIDTQNLVEVKSITAKLIEKIPSELVDVIEINEKSDKTRLENIVRLLELFKILDIEKKIDDISKLFVYKAMNISGIGLKDEDFGEIRVGKYVQIIAITYEPDKNGKKRAKNISLGYFGKAETLSLEFKNEIIEFVLRWRYEKAFQNLKHYRVLLAKIS